MSADLKTKYGSSGNALSITLASLANGSARQSAEVSNASDLFLDVLVTIKLKSATVGVSQAGYATVYAFGTTDGGTTRTEGAGSGDAAITLVNPTNLRMIGMLNMVGTSVTYVAGPFSVAQAFGGVLPEKWGIVIENSSGAAFTATGSDHAVTYQGVYGQSV